MLTPYPEATGSPHSPSDKICSSPSDTCSPGMSLSGSVPGKTGLKPPRQHGDHCWGSGAPSSKASPPQHHCSHPGVAAPGFTRGERWRSWGGEGGLGPSVTLTESVGPAFSVNGPSPHDPIIGQKPVRLIWFQVYPRNKGTTNGTVLSVGKERGWVHS